MPTATETASIAMLGGTSVGTALNLDTTFGECRNSLENFPTDRLFTGQRLDDTGLYFYNARYYDAAIGRFISPDTIVQNAANPQKW
jgi:RHS repeat-associated protein